MTNTNQTLGAARTGLRLDRVVMLLLVAALTGVSSIAAQDGWNFSAGLGVYSENVYVGSDDYYLTPLPSFKATYTKGEMSYSISVLEGLNITYFSPQRGILAGLTVNAGNRRNPETYSVVGFDVDHSSDTRNLLEDTPELFNKVYIDATLAYFTPVGLIGGSFGYYPTTIEYRSDGIEDVSKGMLYSIHHIMQKPISRRISFLTMSAVEFMNDDYAEAWYSVENETTLLDTFDAGGGIRDVQFVLQVNYRFTDRVSASLDYMGTVLLGDAEKSPYTLDQFQQTIGVQTTYSF